MGLTTNESGVAKEKNEAARYTISVGSASCSQAEPNGLESVSVEDHQDMIGVCELTFSGGGTSWSSVKVDDNVEIQFGEDNTKVFKGFVTGMRHGYQMGRDTMTVLAMDPLCKLQASRKTKTWEKKKDSEVAQAVIADSGVPAGQIDATQEQHPWTFQRNESNLEFLRRLAGRNGYLVRAKDGKVDFCKQQFNEPAVDVGRSDLISLDYSFSPKSLPKDTTVYGWDYLKKQKVEGKASAGDIQLIGGGKNAVADAPTWQGENFVSDIWVGSQQMAKDVAVAELNRMARNFLKGKAVVQGNGKLHMGKKVKFKENAPGFNPEAVILSSRHRVYVGSGFTTEIVFASNTYPDGG